jgi:hypothetical protein
VLLSSIALFCSRRHTCRRWRETSRMASMSIVREHLRLHRNWKRIHPRDATHVRGRAHSHSAFPKQKLWVHQVMAVRPFGRLRPPVTSRQLIDMGPDVLPYTT